MKRLTYDDCYNVIALYAPKMLPVFADGWSRFPQGQAASMIVNQLDLQEKSWIKIDETIAQKIAEVKNEIILREEK